MDPQGMNALYVCMNIWSVHLSIGKPFIFVFWSQVCVVASGWCWVSSRHFSILLTAFLEMPGQQVLGIYLSASAVLRRQIHALECLSAGSLRPSHLHVQRLLHPLSTFRVCFIFPHVKSRAWDWRHGSEVRTTAASED